jgi:hypothetical protein
VLRFPDVGQGQLSISDWGSALTPVVDLDRRGQAIHFPGVRLSTTHTPNASEKSGSQ